MLILPTIYEEAILTQSRSEASRFLKETISVLSHTKPTTVGYVPTMMISSPDDNDPPKGILALTSLGWTKKKGGSTKRNKSIIKQESRKNKENSKFKFIAVNDATLPVDLNISLRPSNDFADSVLGPYSTPLQGPAFSRTPRQTTSIPPIPSDTSHHETKSFEHKLKDFSMRSTLITERFEIILDSVDDVNLRTKALVIFGKLINVDPSRKMIAYYNNDEPQYPILENTYDLPIPIDQMSKYISAPLLNPKAKKLMFHTRFRSVTSLLEMKRDQAFMLWLKTHKIYTSVMTLTTTENIRAGFFLGKCPHLTNLAAFTNWVKTHVSQYSTDCPNFQLNAEVIARFKDPTTKSRAIVVICAREKVDHLKELFDTAFLPRSNFPFTPFRVMYMLDARTQSALYKTHKSKIYGPDMMETA